MTRNKLSHHIVQSKVAVFKTPFAYPTTQIIFPSTLLVSWQPVRAIVRCPGASQAGSSLFSMQPCTRWCRWWDSNLSIKVALKLKRNAHLHCLCKSFAVSSPSPSVATGTSSKTWHWLMIARRSGYLEVVYILDYIRSSFKQQVYRAAHFAAITSLDCSANSTAFLRAIKTWKMIWVHFAIDCTLAESPCPTPLPAVQQPCSKKCLPERGKFHAQIVCSYAAQPGQSNQPILDSGHHFLDWMLNWAYFLHVLLSPRIPPTQPLRPFLHLNHHQI